MLMTTDGPVDSTAMTSASRSGASMTSIDAVSPTPASVDRFQHAPPPPPPPRLRPQRFSTSALQRLQYQTGDGTWRQSGDAADGPMSGGVMLRRRDVAAHRGSLMSLAVLLAARRSSCPAISDDLSACMPVCTAPLHEPSKPGSVCPVSQRRICFGFVSVVLLTRASFCFVFVLCYLCVLSLGCSC